MGKLNKAIKDEKSYCGIIFIGGGSSWAWGSTPEQVANDAAKICKRDWKGFFNFEKGKTLKVNIYDMVGHNGWYADERGVFDEDTNELIKRHSVIDVVLK